MATPTKDSTPDTPMMDLNPTADTSAATMLIPEAPVTKLDADQFMVEDIDGITESLFGTGNMNFIMMQSAQTNGVGGTGGEGALDTAGDVQIAGTDNAAFLAPTAAMSLGGIDMGLDRGNASPTMDRAAMSGGDFGDNIHGHDAGVTNATGGSISANQARSGNGAASFSSNSSSVDISVAGPGAPGRDGANAVTQDGQNGTDGQDGDTGSGDPDITIINVINQGPIINVTDINLGDTITTIINHGPTIIKTITDILDSGSPDHDVSLGGGNISLVGIDIPLDGLLPLDLIIDPVEDLLGDIDLNIVPGLDLFGPGEISNAAGDHDIRVNTGVQLLDGGLLNLTGNIPLDGLEAILGDIDLDVTGAINLLGDAAAPLIDAFNGGNGSTLTSQLGDAVSDLAGGLLGQGRNDGGDTDLNIGLDLGNGAVLNAGLILNSVENLLGDIDISITPGLHLFDPSNTSNAAGDSDITLHTGIELLDNGLLGPGLDIQLDGLEAIVGDIDLDITVAADLLGQTAGGLLDNLSGGTADGGLLGDLGQGLSDLGGGLLGTGGDGLLGQVTDGLNGLPDALDLLGQGPVGGDTDINLGGLQLNLDAVENIVGDLDIAAPHIELLGDGQTSNALGDSDITIGGDIELLGHHVVTLPTLDIPLDGLEGLVGDIDLNLGAGIDLLGQTAGSVVDGLAGGSHEHGLIGNLVTDLTSTIDTDTSGALGDILDSVTAVTQPLVDGTVSSVNDLLGEINHTVSSPVEALTTWTTDIVDAASSGAGFVADGIVHSVGDLVGATAAVVDPALNNLTTQIDDLINHTSTVLNVTPAVDLLGSVTSGISSAVASTPLSSVVTTLWPEITIPAANDAGSHGTTGGLLSSILPDPIGHVSEGLSSLDLHHGSSNHHHGWGGLFG